MYDEVTFNAKLGTSKWTFLIDKYFFQLSIFEFFGIGLTPTWFISETTRFGTHISKPISLYWNNFTLSIKYKKYNFTLDKPSEALVFQLGEAHLLLEKSNWRVDESQRLRYHDENFFPEESVLLELIDKALSMKCESLFIGLQVYGEGLFERYEINIPVTETHIVFRLFLSLLELQNRYFNDFLSVTKKPFVIKQIRDGSNVSFTIVNTEKHPVKLYLNHKNNKTLVAENIVDEFNLTNLIAKKGDLLSITAQSDNKKESEALVFNLSI